MVFISWLDVVFLHPYPISYKGVAENGLYVPEMAVLKGTMLIPMDTLFPDKASFQKPGGDSLCRLGSKERSLTPCLRRQRSIRLVENS